jgi:hypothetical protein
VGKAKLVDGLVGPGDSQRRPAPVRSSRWKQKVTGSSWDALEELTCFGDGAPTQQQGEGAHRWPSSGLGAACHWGAAVAVGP